MFELNNKFIEKYKYKDPKFGFNGLGKLAYVRTYSRLKCNECGSLDLDYDENNNKYCKLCNSSNIRNEEFYETIKRVVEGTYEIQKEHIDKYGLGWDEEKAQESAQEMYDRMFNMKFLPPGRGLWGMGTPITTKRKLFAALNNCAFYSTKDIDKNPTKPFEFMMDMSMLGVGVGFDTKGADKIQIKSPYTEYHYTIPDSREGWVESLKLLLYAYLVENSAMPVFNYDLIREAGKPIRTFGGVSSGPDPLKTLHDRIKDKLSNRTGEYLTKTDIVDIMNYIGVCVVAGNVRRTAQVAFGDKDDEYYLDLKNYSKNPHRAEYGWTSNNSIFAEIGMDYSKAAERTKINGEPGYAWLDNMRQYGRMKDYPDNKDSRVEGANPCLEQSLESAEMCCLVETFPTRAESKEDYLRTLKFAYLYAKTVTLGNTHWVETNRVMLRNRRIGTSISGIAEFIDENGIHKFKEWLDEGYNTIQYYDNVYSEWFAIPKSIKTTSIKPSGTVSLLPGVTPGMHYPESNYYIRRITLSKNSDLIEPCKKAGYKIENSVYDSNSVIVEIPVKIDSVRPANKVTMWEQLLLAAFLQENWSDNQVSVTVTFNEDEKDQIKHSLNYFQYKLKSVSFLPRIKGGSYPQMPYEAITEEQYNELNKNITELNIHNTNSDSKPELYCDGDTCTI